MNNLKCLREKKGMSQAEVATAVGVTPQAVGKWERGESDPQWAQAPKLAALFGCTVDALFGLDRSDGSQAS